MEVISGRLEFFMDGKGTILTENDPPLVIPRYHVHSFRFFKGEPATFKEKTDPPGDFKETFFENLLDDGKLTIASTLRACYWGDTYLALPGGIKLLDQVFTLLTGPIASYFFPQKHKGMLAENIAKAE